MRALGLVALGVAAMAQERVPMGILRGDLVEWRGSVAGGELAIRAADNRVLRCAFDSKTYFERERQRISILGLRIGEKLEMVSDQRQRASLCYAMMVHVMETQPQAPPGRRAPRYTSITESYFPRGDLTFAGVVVRVNPARLVLRTREGEQSLLLRHDTRYLRDGAVAAVTMLQLNTRVFVRAGRNFENEIEAYQVIAGAILAPEK